MKKEIVKVGICQLACLLDVNDNMKNAMLAIREVAKKGAQIVCLQELFSSQYFCNAEDYANFELAEPVPGPKTEILQKLAEELNVVIIASLFEKRTDGLFHNTAAVIDADGKYLGKYRKNHIPDDPGFYEKFYFSPGDTGYQVFKTKYARIGVLICWDQWFPEAARITSLMGADILFYPTAIGWAESQTQEVNTEQFNAWQTVQRAHAISNGVYVVSVNRTGRENNMIFWGGSFVCNPFGTILHQSPYDKEDVQVISIDLSKVNFYRTHWPFLRDRRIDTYSGISHRYID